MYKTRRYITETASTRIYYSLMILCLSYTHFPWSGAVFGTVIPPHGCTAGVSLNRSSCISQVYTAQ